MATASYVRGNFLGGERSKFAQGRYDLQDYPTALNVCLNALPVETGTWVRRPGTRFIGQTFGGLTARLISFAFKNALPYTLEFVNTHLRAWAAVNVTAGISAVYTNDPQIVTAISTAAPAQVTTQNNHGWSTGDHVQFTEAGTAVTPLQNREFVIAVTGAKTFTLQDQITGENVDGTTLGAIPAGLTVNRIWGEGSIYTAAQLPAIRKVQAETTAIFLHPAVAPQGLAVLTPPAGLTFATFTPLSAASLTDGPYLDQYVGTTLTNTGVSGSITLQTGGSAFPGFKANDVGRLIRIFSQPPQWAAGAYVSGAVVALYEDPVNYPTVATYYQANKNTSNGPPNLVPADWVLVTGSQYAVWTWGTITAVNSASNVTATINGSSPLLYNSATNYAWRLGAYGGDNGFPTCGCYHEGRIWLFGAIGNRFDASVSNAISVSGNTVSINFAPTDPSGNVGAANAITGVMTAEDSNPILWAQSHQQGVICGTQPAEWLIFAPSSGALAPNNIAVHRVTKIGGLNVEAVWTEHTIIFVQRYARKLIEYFADIFSGKFAAPHVTQWSKHLTDGGVAEIAYQQELAPILWARLVTKKLVGWVYKRDTLMSSQGPTIAAGHRHTLGSGRVVESIATGPSVGGTTDTLMLATNDTGTNVRYVEALTDIPDEGATLLDAQYVDTAIAPSWVLAAPTGSMPYGGMTLSGLWALKGKSVAAWIGGLDCGDYVVNSTGQITVPFGDGISGGTGNGLLTQGYVLSIPEIPIWVGFTYTSDGQIVRPNHPSETGARNGPGFMKLRRTNWFGLQLEGAVTGSISFGTDFSSLQAATFTHPNGGPKKSYTVLEQFTGIYRDTGKDSDSFDSQICWRVTRPYPCNIVAVGGALETKDI